MDDAEILHRINELVEEEHGLERSRLGTGLSADEHARLERLEVALDQCWDLLRQRRARRNAGEDPADATLRSDDVVERYQQ